MTQRNNSAQNSLQRSWKRSLPAHSLCWLGSFSLLSSGLVFAQTETAIDNIVPTVENTQPNVAPKVKNDIVGQSRSNPVPESTRPQPEFSVRRAQLRQKLRRVEVSENSGPVVNSRSKIGADEPAVHIRRSRSNEAKKPQVEIATPPASRASEEKVPPAATSTNRTSTNVSATTNTPKDYNNSYIDPNNYEVGTTTKYEAPNSVVLTERSSGCRATLAQGQGVSGGLCAKTPDNQRLAGKQAPSWMRKSQNVRLANVSTSQNRNRWRASRAGVINPNNSGLRANRVASNSAAKTAFNPNRFLPNNFISTKVSSSPIAPAGGTLPPPMADGNIAPRDSTVSYNIPLVSVLPQIPYTGTLAYSGTGLRFPLSVPASITSLFGWRVHPITGDTRFHSGTDLGAAMGTPVLAAATGQVEAANYMGGYGLAVTLNHNSTKQTLYGHLSEILVQPGQWVQQGTVIGRVGSTGNSTGPHLHFEVRQMTPQGWVATDPGVQLETALNQLIQSLQTAQATQQPGS